MSQDLNAELSRIYESCIEQVRMIAALDPSKPVEGWDQYTCTAAHEFASETETAWVEAHPEYEWRETYRAIMGDFSIERGSVPGDLPTRYLTYGLMSFARVLQCIEAMRTGRFDPRVPGGIIDSSDS
ncbi:MULTISPECIES: hypothetical protein [Streptomyces]|uniref:hypothetical protein n=1 Tax=Streptomyces TaxID=1883 RepID=UPI0010D6D054|nr:hypothetical protein [Streptomyces albidoflavus]MYX51412.1 hypothetical protein [Streptomyces sp. SID8385]RZD78244.1 hypothetical protein C0Q61_14505 [Streptomyces albidoflavus]